MGRNLAVIKVGGSVLKSPHSYVKVAEELSKTILREGPTLLVVSAMQGVTDILIRVLEGSNNGLRYLRELYLRAAREVSPELEGAVLTRISRLKEALRYRRTKRSDAEILSIGEIISKELMVEALKNTGVVACPLKAEDIIVAEDKGGVAIIDYQETLARLRKAVIPPLESGAVPVIEGFIASCGGGSICVLGRGGSDYTATSVGALLEAEVIHLYTAVEGVMSADPSIVNNAKVVECLTYREAMHASIAGVKRFHPLTFHPLLHIHPSTVIVGPLTGGTLITEKCGKGQRPKIISLRRRGDVAEMRIVGEVNNAAVIVQEILRTLLKYRVRVLAIEAYSDKPSVTVKVPAESGSEAVRILHNALITHAGKATVLEVLQE